jgi:hypothetical protein
VEEILASLLKALAQRLPFLLVCIAGIALVVVRWRRSPRASLLALLGLATFLISSLGALFVYEALPRWIVRWQASPERASLVYSTASVLFYAIDGLGLALLLAAVFAERARIPSA